MKTNRLFLIALAIGFSLSAQAQTVVKIGGGGGTKNGSIYSSMIGTMAETCNNDNVRFEEQQNPLGSKDNLTKLKNNQLRAALIQSDVLAAARLDNASSVANIKTIYAFHYEAVHLIARGGVKQEGGTNLGFMTVGGNKVTFNTPEDLRGRQVGAVGGSAVTGSILADVLKFGWKINTEYKDNAELLAALQSGKIDAVLVMAGKQSPAVAGIKGNFKLIPLRGNSDTEAVYKSFKVEYDNLNGGKAVDTLATRAALVARTGGTPEQLKAWSDLRQCLTTNLEAIKGTEGTHPSWNDVDPSDRGDARYWYELPSTTVAAPAPAPAPAKKR